MAREYLPVAIDRLVHERAREQCEYCRAPADITAAPFNIEHIQPLARGGNSEESNLALACAGCNLAKSARTTATAPVTGRAVPLFHPRRGRWSEHFGWSEEGATSRLTPQSDAQRLRHSISIGSNCGIYVVF